MARQYAPVCRYCRREGLKLMLKGVRCETAKCPIEREFRNKPPGMHAWRRGKSSEYGVRLREKQKVKRYYGVLEKQFQRLFTLATKGTDNTGVNLMQLLERRLDNALYKSGLAGARRTARQMIAHGHVHVNGRKIDRPGYLVRVGDVLSIRGSERSQNFAKSQIGDDPRPPQSWLMTEHNKLTTKVIALPQREDVLIPVEENLIVEFCSR